MPYKNPEDKKARDARFRAENPELHKSRSKSWRDAQPAGRLAARAKKNREIRIEKDPEAEKRRDRNNRLKSNYGIDLAAFDAMVQQQDGLCASCKSEFEEGFTDIDHCHETGRVRGILCRKCNTALGLLQEDPERIEGLMTYVRERC